MVTAAPPGVVVGCDMLRYSCSETWLRLDRDFDGSEAADVEEDVSLKVCVWPAVWVARA